MADIHRITILQLYAVWAILSPMAALSLLAFGLLGSSQALHEENR